MSHDQIPLVDLAAQHAEVADEVTAGFQEVCRTTAFILGPHVSRFEQEFARYAEVSHCVGVGSGTDAIEMMLRAVGIGSTEGSDPAKRPTDEVIVPANTFIATALAVLRAGGRPVLVDCDDFYLIDPNLVADRITPRTRALLPVHLFGQIADVESLAEVAASHGVVMLEDAAQSHGARRHGRANGALGRAAAVSFYPGKNLGAYGDGGAVLTNDSEIAERTRKLRNWGSEKKYHHPELGFNSRLDTLQAVVLSAKLKRLDAWNEARRRAASLYDQLLATHEAVRTPRTLTGNEHVFHLYVVRVAHRDRVLASLLEAGIGAGIHYPTPLHLHGALRHLGYHDGDFPLAEKAAAEMLSLPLHPHLTESQQERIVSVLAKAL